MNKQVHSSLIDSSLNEVTSFLNTLALRPRTPAVAPPRMLPTALPPSGVSFSVEGLQVHTVPLHPCFAILQHRSPASASATSAHSSWSNLPALLLEHRRRPIGPATPASRNHGGAGGSGNWMAYFRRETHDSGDKDQAMNFSHFSLAELVGLSARHAEDSRREGVGHQQLRRRHTSSSSRP
jgi:hypothetical protein